MTNLVVCLGSDPEDKGIILPVLEERLKDAIKLCVENPGSTLFLMGGHSFRIKDKNVPDQAEEMEKYITKHVPNKLGKVTIILDNEASSTVEQINLLREFIEEEAVEMKVSIVASEFFVERVKLYAEYILAGLEDAEIGFVASRVPAEDSERFKEIEEGKLAEARKWLSKNKKGDYQTILQEHKEFEQKIIAGEIKHPISFKPR